MATTAEDLMGLGLSWATASKVIQLVNEGTSDTAVRLGVSAGASQLPTSSVAVGANALQVATGIQNTMVGRSAGTAISVGTNNVGVGNRALAELTTGSNNTAIGGGVMDGLVDGSDNTAVGKNALQELVSGTSNVAVGYGAGWYTTGNGNLYVGYNAGPAGPTTTFEQDQVYINNSAGFPLIGGSCASNYVKMKVPTSAPSDGNLSGSASGTAYGSVTIWLNEAGNTLNFKVKYSNGSTVKSGTVALT